MTSPDAAGGSSGDSPQLLDPQRNKTFEELMAELEELTALLAAGDVGIEAAADLYERAEVLHAQARERLDQVRARVERLGSATTLPGNATSSGAGGDETVEPCRDGAS